MKRDQKTQKKKKVPGMPTNTRESVKDERFQQVLRNPVYRPVPKKEKKIEIDRRFQGMFNDEKFKLKYKVDKRGRPLAAVTDEDMKRYYNLGEDEKEEDDEKEEEDESSSSSDDEDEDVEGNVKEEEITTGKLRQKIDQATRKKLHSSEIDYARGEGDLEGTSSSSSDDEDSSDEDDNEVSMLEHDWGELDKDAARTEESTKRLALCNMDWDRVRAVDLMVLLSSFLPPGGIIKQVAIFPSEFGKERMAEEEREGPRELRATKEDQMKIKKEEEKDTDTSDDEENGSSGEEDEEGSQYHREKLRQYQLNRLKYFYAVAEFDSAATADKVYSECDGMEYESSAAKVDLRFIPDDMSFEEEEAKEVCKEMPLGEKYRPRFFTTTALQQVKVDLTWDETDPLRKELTEKIFDPKEKVDDDDIRAYLATSSEEEDDDDEEDEAEQNVIEEEKSDNKKMKKQDAISKYKALLEGIELEDEKKKKRDNAVEMEITWGVGLKEEAEKLVKKKLEDEEKKKRTPWEEMLDKRKEKRQMKKKEKKVNKDEEEDDEQPFSDDDVDVDMDDEFFKSELRENEIFKDTEKTKGSKKQNKHRGQEEENEKKKSASAELELLLMEDDEELGKRHFSLKKIIEEETDSKSKKKRKWRKNKKKGGEQDVEGNNKIKDDFEIDVEDRRFSALFNSHHYNVDPSDPNFKKTKAMERIIEEKQKRRATASTSSDPHGESDLAKGAANNSNNVTTVKKRKMEQSEKGDIANKTSKSSAAAAELTFLVKSVKRNTENLKMIQQKKNSKSKFKK